MKFIIFFVIAAVFSSQPFVSAQSLESQSKNNRFENILLNTVARLRYENFMISPPSIKFILRMISEGADGRSAEQLFNVLPFEDIFTKQLNSLVSTDFVKVRVANAIFLNKEYQVNPDYKKILKNKYSSDVNEIDFQNGKSAARKINKFISTLTNNYIPTLIPNELQKETQMLLVNALFFKGVWNETFTPMQNPKEFCNGNGCSFASMMRIESEFNYGQIEDLNCQIVDVPYKDGLYSMLLVLPHTESKLNEFLQNFSPDLITHMLNKMTPTNVEILLPKFSINYETDLITVLRQMDITDIFDGHANLLKMVLNGVKSPLVNGVYHKTLIQVDEKGSVATASTLATIGSLSVNTHPILTFNQPFLFFLRNVKTGAILFEGVVINPNTNGPQVN